MFLQVVEVRPAAAVELPGVGLALVENRAKATEITRHHKLFTEGIVGPEFWHF